MDILKESLSETTSTMSSGATPKNKRAKMVMLGETSTGKTSLATRFSKKVFHEFQESTIGAAYMTGKVPSLGCTFEIWDTAGQERYHSLAPMYYRGAKAAAVVFDITSRTSFEKAKEWIDELRKDGPSALVIALVGNKADLGSKREVAEAEARAFAESQSLLFMETSAKSGFCVEDLFEVIARQLNLGSGMSNAGSTTASATSGSLEAGGITLEHDPNGTDGGAESKTGGCC